MYALAISNPIQIKKRQCDTLILEFKDKANAFGYSYQSFPTFYQRVRLGINVRKFKFPTSESVYRASDGVFRRNNVIIDKTRELHTDLIDEDTMESLQVALHHSDVFISGVSYSAQGELEIEDNEVSNLANGKATLYVQGFNKTNISCQ